jgi:hypothetical protein
MSQIPTWAIFASALDPLSGEAERLYDSVEAASGDSGKITYHPIDELGLVTYGADGIAPQARGVDRDVVKEVGRMSGVADNDLGGIMVDTL